MLIRRRRAIWLMIVVAIALPASIVMTSVVYKRAIGFNSFHDYVDDWIYPRKLAGFMRPLERKELPEFRGDTSAISGFPFPATWTAQVIKVDNNWYKIEATLPAGPPVKINVTPVEQALLNTEFQTNLQNLPEKYAANWQSFIGLFPSELELLERVFESEVPEPLHSDLLPLFPPNKDYRYEAVVLTAKSLAAHGRLLLLHGRNRFFLIDFPTQGNSAVVMLGRFKGGRVDGELLISQPGLNEAVVFQICGAIDAGDFAPRLPAREAAEPSNSASEGPDW